MRTTLFIGLDTDDNGQVWVSRISELERIDQEEAKLRQCLWIHEVVSILESILVDGHEPELSQLLDFFAHDDRGSLIHDCNLSLLRYFDSNLDLLSLCIIIKTIISIPEVLGCNTRSLLNLVHYLFITVLVILLLGVEISIDICRTLYQ